MDRSAAVPAQKNIEVVDPASRYRFQIALSFPGEYRFRVEAIAEILASSVDRDAILYDRWLAAEFARPNLDVYLVDLYHKHSLLLVFFFCGDYVLKEWCGLEWRAGRDLLKHKEDHRLILLRLDGADIPGIYSIDGYLDIANMQDSEVASAILTRLALLNGAPVPVPPPTQASTAELEVPDAPEYWQQRKLLGDTPVFVKIKGRPRWCIWIRPTKFKRARFQSVQQCERFMRASAGRFRDAPRFSEASLEMEKDWIAHEVEDANNTINHAERWVLFRSGQFVYNLAFDENKVLGDRTHPLEILDTVTAAFELAASMVREGILSQQCAIDLDFYGVDGRGLTWPQDAVGYNNAIDQNSWSQDSAFRIKKVVQTDVLLARRRELALELAMHVYAAFGSSDPPRGRLKTAQAEKFGPMI